MNVKCKECGGRATVLVSYSGYGHPEWDRPLCEICMRDEVFRQKAEGHVLPEVLPLDYPHPAVRYYLKKRR